MIYVLTLFLIANGQASMSASLGIENNDAVSIESYINLANRNKSEGLFIEAERLLLLSKKLAKKSNNKRQQLLTYISLGDLYLLTNRRSDAILELDAGERLAKEYEIQELLAAVFINKGNIYAAEGKSDKAISSYKRALKLSINVSDNTQRVLSLINISKTLLVKKDYIGSVTYLDEIFPKINNSQTFSVDAFELSAIASLYQKILLAEELSSIANDLKLKVVRLFDEASLKAEASGDLYVASFSYGSLALIYQSDKRYADAKVFLRRAIFLAQQINANELIYQWKWALGRIHRELDNSDEAIREYREAVTVLQSVRSKFSGSSRMETTDLYESSHSIYFELADLLLTGSDSNYVGKEYERRLYEARETIELLKAAELQDYFKDSCVTALQSRTVGIDQLNQHTAVIYIVPLSGRLELLLSLSGSIQKYTVPVDRVTFKREIERFRINLETRTTRRFMKQSRQLYDWLIKPIESSLIEHGITTLVSVPQGSLMGIPLASLHSGSEYLIEKYALATTPGLALTEPNNLKKENINILLAGISESVQGFPALPHVPEELKSINQIFNGAVYIDKDFSTSRINDSMKNVPYSIVHLASHAQFEGESDEAFLLTYSEKLNLDSLEMLMGISEFRDTPVELLTLSACQTAAGNDKSALGLAGIAIKAGARSALASLWFVSDDSTSKLMVGFYSNLQAQGVSKAEALQKAQIEIMQDYRYRHPAYWAPFLLIGNWL